MPTVKPFLLSAALVTITLLVLAAMPARANTPIPQFSVGKTIHVVLDKGETQDYIATVPKGDYYAILDTKRSDNHSGNIQVTARLLKNNGVIVDNYWLNSNDVATQSRNGKSFHVAKPTVMRFRFSHEQELPLDSWFTIVPAGAGFVPFGFAATIVPGKIGTDNAVGGTIDGDGVAYQRITLPAGKWEISLGLKMSTSDKSNLQGQIDILDTRGLMRNHSFVFVNEVDNEARKDATLTLTKPTAIILQITNTNSNTTYNYDVTIEKPE